MDNFLENVFYSKEFGKQDRATQDKIIEDVKTVFENDVKVLSITEQAIARDKFQKDLAEKMDEMMDIEPSKTPEALKYRTPVGTIDPTTKEEAVAELARQKGRIETQEQRDAFEAQDPGLQDTSLSLAFPASGAIRAGGGVLAGSAKGIQIGLNVAKAETAAEIATQGSSAVIENMTEDEFKQQHPVYYGAMQLLGTLASAGTAGAIAYKNPTIERFEAIDDAVQTKKITPQQADEAIQDAVKIGEDDIAEAQKFLDETKQPKVSEEFEGGSLTPEQVQAKLETPIQEQEIIKQKVENFLPNESIEAKADIARRIQIELDKNKKPTPANIVPKGSLESVSKQQRIKEASVPEVGGSEDIAKQKTLNIMNEKDLDSQYKNMSKEDMDYLNREYSEEEAKKIWDESEKVFAKGGDNVGAGLIAGIEQDENGSITLDPVKFIAGMGGYTAVKQLAKNKLVRQELKDYAQKALDKVEGNPLFDFRSRIVEEKKPPNNDFIKIDNTTARKRTDGDWERPNGKIIKNQKLISKLEKKTFTPKRANTKTQESYKDKLKREFEEDKIKKEETLKKLSFLTDKEKKDIFYAGANIDKTNLIKSVGRILRKKIGKPYYISRNKEKQISSYYFNLNGEKIRVSEHELPVNAQRYEKLAQSGQGNFDREIIVDNLDDVNNLIKEVGKEKAQLKKESTKVVDEKGKPLTVYHGTDKNFKDFDPNKSFDGGLWFTSDLDALKKGEVGAGGKGRIIKANLNVKKMAGWDEYEKYSLAELRRDGYDGVKLDDDYIVFENSQVKQIKNPLHVKKSTKIQSSPTAGAATLGATAGVEVDEQGNINYNIAKGTLGALGATGAYKGASKLHDIYKNKKAFIPDGQLPPETKAQVWQRVLQDKFNRVKQLQKVKAGSKEIADELDVYRAEERYSGRTQYRIDKFQEERVDPNIKIYSF